MMTVMHVTGVAALCLFFACSSDAFCPGSLPSFMGTTGRAISLRGSGVSTKGRGGARGGVWGGLKMQENPKRSGGGDIAQQQMQEEIIEKLRKKSAELELAEMEAAEALFGEGGGAGQEILAAPASTQENNSTSQGFFSDAKAIWKEMMEPKFDNDTSLPAMRVKYNLEVVENCQVIIKDSAEPELVEWARAEQQEAFRELLPDIERRSWGLIQEYWSVRLDRMLRSKKLRAALPAFANVFNAAFLVIFLRLTLPRLLAMESMGDLGDFATSLGLPGREQMKEYLTYAEGLNYGTKFAAFTSVFAVEKALLIGDFVPFGVILPTISPALFGGVMEGALTTALASTLASSVNFQLGRKYLTKQITGFKMGEMPPIGEAGWFKALYRRFDSDNFPDSFPPEGFKAMLLLRLAPLLPIPVDAHWYVAGTTRVRYSEFFAAHFLGTMKVAILDAYLGSLLLQAVTDTEKLQAQTKLALVLETGGLLLVSVLVTNLATQIFTQIMAEEGVSDMNPLSSPEPEAESSSSSSS